MAGPKNKSKKIKRIFKTDKDGNEIFMRDDPREAYTSKEYNKSGKKSGVQEYSFIDKTGKGGSFSARSKTRDVNPNKRVKEIRYTDDPKRKQVVTSSTQKGNYNRSSKSVPANKKSKGTIKKKSKYSL